jgi:hypothetical protein
MSPVTLLSAVRVVQSSGPRVDLEPPTRRARHGCRKCPRRHRKRDRRSTKVANLPKGNITCRNVWCKLSSLHLLFAARAGWHTKQYPFAGRGSPAHVVEADGSFALQDKQIPLRDQNVGSENGRIAEIADAPAHAEAIDVADGHLVVRAREVFGLDAADVIAQGGAAIAKPWNRPSASATSHLRPSGPRPIDRAKKRK